jgi:hypothetical protein
MSCGASAHQSSVLAIRPASALIVLIDLSAGDQRSEKISAKVGAENIFNTHPTRPSTKRCAD